jgi:hypothetical protein
MTPWVGKILGQTSLEWWVQVHDFIPENPDQIQNRGRLIAAIALRVEGKEQIELVATGREIIARIHELYYGEVSSSPLDQLKQAVANIEEEFTRSGAQVNIAAVCLVGESIHVAAYQGGAWVRVGQKEGWIINPSTIEGIVALSGKLLPDQIVLVGSSGFWKEMPMGIIKAAIENEEGEAMLETLGTVVHGNDRMKGGVGVVIRSAGVVRPDAPEIVESVDDDEVELPAVAPAVPIDHKSPKPAGISLRQRLQVLQSKLPTFRRPVYVISPDKTKGRRNLTYVGIGFLVIVGILMGGWQYRKRNVAQVSSATNIAIQETYDKFREAQALLDLNPVRSRELLAQVEQETKKLSEEAGKKKKDSRLIEIEEGLPAVLGAATGTRTLESQEVINLGLVREGMTGQWMRYLDGQLWVLDTSGSRLMKIDPTKKKGEVVVGQESLGTPKTLAVYPGKIEVLSDKGIVECQTSNNKCQVTVQADGDWGNIVDMGMFGGNIYLLSNQEIWRHQVTETGFSQKQDWLAEGEDKSDLSQSQSLSIDGSLWIATPDSIMKYTRGVKDSFEISGLDSPLGNKTAIYVTDETDKLYILDAANGRIVILAKTGEYDSQIVTDQAKSATALVVDEKNSTLYLLAADKIWEASLQ